jgi:hypothetical protein
MINQQNQEFVDFLFGKLLKHVDTDMIDLHDDDTAGIDALELRAAELEVTVDELIQQIDC